MAAYGGLWKIITRIVGRGLSTFGLQAQRLTNNLFGRFVQAGYNIEREAVAGILKKQISETVSEGFADQLSKKSKYPRFGMIEEPLIRSNKYRVYGKAQLYDETTGRLYEEWQSFYDDEERTVEEYEDILQKNYVTKSDTEGIQVVGFRLDYVKHNNTVGY